jgi:hypothetical protein
VWKIILLGNCGIENMAIGLKFRYSEVFMSFVEIYMMVNRASLSNLDIVAIFLKSFNNAKSVILSYFYKLANVILCGKFLLKFIKVNEGKDLLQLCRAYTILSSSIIFLKYIMAPTS